MKRGDLDIELTDEAVDVKLNASARSPNAKLGGFLFIMCGILLMDAALLFMPGKPGHRSMWNNMVSAKSPSDWIAPVLILTAGTISLAWLGFRWARAAWPSDEHFHCDRTALTLARIPYLDFKSRNWNKTSFALADVSRIRFDAYASAKGGTIYGLRFCVQQTGHKALPGLEAPEAQKILLALQRLGADVIIDKTLQKRVDEAVANRYGEQPSIS
jgi:hypothetical protein